MNIREVLLPTDFSRVSESAGRVARELALKMGARLRVIHVALPGTDPAGIAVALTAAERKFDAERAGRRGTPA